MRTRVNIHMGRLTSPAKLKEANRGWMIWTQMAQRICEAKRKIRHNITAHMGDMDDIMMSGARGHQGTIWIKNFVTCFVSLMDRCEPGFASITGSAGLAAAGGLHI